MTADTLGRVAIPSGHVRPTGCVIVNADDWGRDRATTDRTLECVRSRCVSSVSTMAFMCDSERAAALAQEEDIDSGLHINLTTPFTSTQCPRRVAEHQARVSAYLRSTRFAQVMFHPGLVQSFEYVVAAQVEEYARLYGPAPARVDGHHHMHLSANVLMQRLLPAGTVARRNFSFRAGEKNIVNRTYRRWVDAALKKRHFVVDYLFAFDSARSETQLQRLAALAKESVIELETHPVDPCEYAVLSRSLPLSLPIRRFRDVEFV